MHAVQIGLAEVMWALAEDRLETRKAWALLNSLQQASSNLTNTPSWKGEREAVAERRPLRAMSDPGFEQRHGLPHDADLDAPPDTTVISGSQPAPADLSVAEEPQDLLWQDSAATIDSPDRVPFPEDELRNLNITRLEQLEFFVYKCKYNYLSDEQEHALLIQWLRQRRAEEAANPELAEERRQFNAECSSRPSPPQEPAGAPQVEAA